MAPACVGVERTIALSFAVLIRVQFVAFVVRVAVGPFEVQLAQNLPHAISPNARLVAALALQCPPTGIDIDAFALSNIAALALASLSVSRVEIEYVASPRIVRAAP